MTVQEAKVLRTAPLATPADLKPNAVRDLAGALRLGRLEGDFRI
jgi:hypothetical protein